MFISSHQALEKFMEITTIDFGTGCGVMLEQIPKYVGWHRMLVVDRGWKEFLGNVREILYCLTKDCY